MRACASGEARARPGSRAPRAGGFALAETLFAVALFGVVFASVTAVTQSVRRAYDTSSRTEELHLRARRTLGRVTQELLAAGGATLLPNPDSDFGADALAFSTPAGLAGTDVVWGDVVRLAFEYDPGETDDGADNDGDGLVDEGRLVLTRDAGGPVERRYVLCRDVAERGEGEVLDGDDDDGDGVRDEAGFNVQRRGDVLTVQLTLERVDGGNRIQQSVAASLRLRN